MLFFRLLYFANIVKKLYKFPNKINVLIDYLPTLLDPGSWGSVLSIAPHDTETCLLQIGDEDSLCTICYAHQKSVIFHPCEHSSCRYVISTTILLTVISFNYNFTFLGWWVLRGVVGGSYQLEVVGGFVVGSSWVDLD